MNRPAVVFPVIALAALVTGPATRATAQPVEFRGKGLTLQGRLFRPSGQGPFPAVVALHGCSGLTNRRGDLSARHADWAERLVPQGFVVLFPDSFASRDAGPQCKIRDRVTRPSRERVEDAFAAKAYLQTLPYVKAASISLLGWSNGASTVLYAVDKRRNPETGSPDFARAVAFYPGCRVPAERGDWHARLPLTILIGGADDWTPAKPCQDLADAAKAAGEPVSIVVYPGAYHDFDHPDLKVHVNEGLAYTAEGGGSAHSGTDPAARADATARVPELLAR